MELKHGLKFYCCLLNVEVNFFQPLLCIKAGATLSDPWEITMTDDFGIGIVEAEALQEFYHRALLGFLYFCTRIDVFILPQIAQMNTDILYSAICNKVITQTCSILGVRSHRLRR